MNTERLRAWPDRPDPELTTNVTSLMNEAADRIEALEAALREIRDFSDMVPRDPYCYEIARAALGDV